MSQGENLSRKDNKLSGGGRKKMLKGLLSECRSSDAGRRKDARYGRVKRGGKESLSQCRVGGCD